MGKKIVQTGGLPGIAQFCPLCSGHPEGTWKCVSVLPALLSSSYRRPRASAGVELLENAHHWLLIEAPSERKC